MGSFLLALLIVGIYTALGVVTVRWQMPKMDRMVARRHRRGSNSYHEKLNREVARAFCIWPFIWIDGIVRMVFGPPWRKIRGYMFEPSDTMIRLRREAMDSAKFWGEEYKRCLKEGRAGDAEQAREFRTDAIKRFNRLSG